MSMQLNPYLSFNSNARQAMEFYHSVFGGKLNINTFKELNAAQDPSEDDLVMHSSLVADSGLMFMASDTPRRMEYKPGSNISMSLSGDDAPALTAYFERLGDGGTITMALNKASWGDTFGMCIDKFGVSWMVNIAPDKTADPSL